MIYLKNSEYDFIMKVSHDVDTSTLTVYYVTNDSKKYTIVATTYEEALTAAGFEASDTTKDAESSYQVLSYLLTWFRLFGRLATRSKRIGGYIQRH